MTTHPGVRIARRIAQRYGTQSGFAEAARFTVKHVNQVVNGHAGVGPEFAVACEWWLGLSADQLVREQASYDLQRWRKENGYA